MPISSSATSSRAVRKCILGKHIAAKIMKILDEWDISVLQAHIVFKQ